MAKERFGSNAQLTGVGTLQTIGNHAYIYSGIKATAGDNTYSTALEFNTGAYYIDGRLVLMIAHGNNDDTAFRLSINSIAIGEWYHATPPNDGGMNSGVPFLLPPNSYVIVEIKNGQSSTARDVCIGYIGKVYE